MQMRLLQHHINTLGTHYGRLLNGDDYLIPFLLKLCAVKHHHAVVDFDDIHCGGGGPWDLMHKRVGDDDRCNVHSCSLTHLTGDCQEKVASDLLRVEVDVHLANIDLNSEVGFPEHRVGHFRVGRGRRGGWANVASEILHRRGDNIAADNA
eukprot:scaffold40719_cov18-Prasinocladus_malaysianus.AAC.1